MDKHNQEKFVILLGQVQPDLRRYIYSLCHNMADTEDVFQETSLALWRKFESYDSSQPFLNWAFRFAYYEVMKLRDKDKKRKVLSEETLKLLADEWERDHDLSQIHDRLLTSCVSKLEESEQELIKMRYSQKMTVVKMNQHFGETGKKTYRALERIRFKLYACIDKHLEIEGLK